MDANANRKSILMMADDDPDDREFVRDAFEHCGFDGEFRVVEDGAELLDYLSCSSGSGSQEDYPLPDLILLDIELDDGTGFDLLDQLHTIDFKIIFITAYDQFALKAFRFSALDYLLKPLDPDDLVRAVAKISDIRQQDFHVQLANLKEHLDSADRDQKKIIIKTHNHIHLIPVKEILYCQSDNNYVTFFLTNKNEIVASANLRDFEEILAESGFFRVHKSYLVNLEFVRRLEKAQGGFVFLEGELKIPVALRKRPELFKKLERLS